MLRRMSACSLGLWLVLGTLVAYSDEIPRLTFAQLVDSIRANLALTQKIQSYNGKEVEMQGFIIPAGPPDLSFFLLSRVSAIGNYCCELPTGQDETVYVYMAKGVQLFYDPLRVYKVRGRFEAGVHTDPANGVSLFRLRQAHVEEAVGAKIMKSEDTPASTR
jgi:hypothetical protein